MFNPFVSCGFDPDEDNFSDALAELMRPNSAHGFGIYPLLGLIAASREQGKLRGLAENVEAVARAIQLSLPARIAVKRNPYRRGLGKPDIVIFGMGEPRFIVAVEKKVWGGSETYNNDGFQTVRYMDWIEEEATEREVEASHTLGIFLTPEDKSAVASAFIPMSSFDMTRAMLKAIDEAKDASPSSRELARAFFITYAWLNGGF